MPKVFLSYAREDLESAQRLYDELRIVRSLDVWFDKESLLPGVRFRPAIRKAIREADYFLALLSNHSVSGRGYRHSELAEAVEVLKEFPRDQIFLIPIRLEECEMPDDELSELTWTDLFPDWEQGMQRLLLVLAPDAGVKLDDVKDSKTGSRSRAYHYRVALVDLDLGLINLKSLAEKLNQTQRFFLFTCPEMPSVKEAVGKIDGLTNLKVYDIPTSFFAEHPNLSVDLVVCLTRYPLAFEEDDQILYNYFAGESEHDERFLFVSTDQLYGFSQQAGVTFEEGLVHTIVGQLVDYFTKIGYHKETRGCVMDHCKIRADQIVGLKSRAFCGDCNGKLPEGDLKQAIQALLSLHY